MALKIYNTLTRAKDDFIALEPNRVHIYVCGPTVYSDAHIGHAKSYIAFDIVVRYFRYLGYQVRYVQNITDVGHLLDSGEDRIMKGAMREKIEPMELVEKYTARYFADMDALNVIRPSISPRASGHIPEQVELTRLLIDKKFAYEVNNSVYFEVGRFREYGKLSRREVGDQEAGARVDVMAEKHHPADFALWKKAEPEHIMRWNSPWGIGYPGWHIECSSMSMKYLGETFDIHGGGMENMFPHHECEIAQSEAATGKPFARYWMHNNMITVNGVKMSKSLGNSLTIQDALKKYTGEQIRFFLLTSHYRSPIDITDTAITGASQGLDRIHALYRQLQAALADAPEGPADGAIAETIAGHKARFLEAIDDDFNTAQAIGVLFDLIRDLNIFLTSGQPRTKATLAPAYQTIADLAGTILGILPFSHSSLLSAEPFVDMLLKMRQDLRREKLFKLSDQIRDSLNQLGVVIEDGKEGTHWRFKF